MRRSRSNLVIKEHNPWKVFFWMTLVMVIVVVGIAMAFELGHDRGEDDGSNTQYQVTNYKATLKGYREKKLRAERHIDALKKQISRLRTEVARLESLNRIDGHAYKKIKSGLTLLRTKNQNLREEIQFYRNIVSPSKINAGLRIHSFKIDPGTAERLYNYRLILVQYHGMKDRHRDISGVVRVYLRGKRIDGSKRTINLKDVTPETEQTDMKFSLKYYKSIEGTMKLPDGFSPVSVRVQIIPNRRTRGGRRSVEKKILWPIKAG